MERSNLPVRQKRIWTVVRTHVTQNLTQEEAYKLAFRLREMGYGSEIMTNDEWQNEKRGERCGQDITPFMPESVKAERMSRGA